MASGPEIFAMFAESEEEIQERERMKQRFLSEETKRVNELADYFVEPEIKEISFVVEISCDDGEPMLKAFMFDQNISGIVTKFNMIECDTPIEDCHSNFNKVFESLLDSEYGVKHLEMSYNMHNRYAPMFIFRKFANRDISIRIGMHNLTIRNAYILVMVEYCFMNVNLRNKILEKFDDLREIEVELLRRTPLFTEVPEAISRSFLDYPEIISQKIAQARIHNPLPEWTEADVIEDDFITDEELFYIQNYNSVDDEYDPREDECMV